MNVSEFKTMNVKGGCDMKVSKSKFVPFPLYENRVSLFETIELDNDSIVFLGDSITQRNEWAEMFQNPNIKNRGIDSDRLEGVWLRLHQITKAKPAKVFLKIGINDISDGKDDTYIVKTYKGIFKQIKRESPMTELYVQSILPVNNSKYHHWIDNHVVQRVNREIKKLAEEYEYTYIHLYPHFVNKQNELHPLFTYDGVHLSGLGYENWKKRIKPFVN